MQKQYQSIR